LKVTRLCARSPASPSGSRPANCPGAAADDHHVEQLLLDRQVPLDLDLERRAGEEVGEQETEQTVPGRAALRDRRALVGSLEINGRF
jgi:hypothetical protein